MRVYKKISFAKNKNINSDILSEEFDFKTIYENVKNYLVFRISVTTKLDERLIYLDVLDYMGRLQLELNKLKASDNK